MRLIPTIVSLVLILTFVSAGCVTRSPAPEITVTGLDTLDISRVEIGSVEVYTEHFQIENPTNRTLSNVEVDLSIIPVTAYCHQQEKTLKYPSISSKQRIVEQVSFTEFSGLECQYSYTYRTFAGN